MTNWMRWGIVRGLVPEDVVTVLEIGAGLGGMGALLAERFAYTGIEPDPVSQAVAAQRTGGRVICATADQLETTFDLVCAFEVIEHILDDEEALREWKVRSDRWLILSTPAGPERFGAWDELGGHFRRYSKESLEATLRAAGWNPVVVRAYGWPLGLLLESVRQRIAHRRARADSVQERTNASARAFQPSGALAYATWAAAMPARLIQTSFPERGHGLIALAERA
jgi:SAM-dependent methyltransferase